MTRCSFQYRFIGYQDPDGLPKYPQLLPYVRGTRCVSYYTSKYISVQESNISTIIEKSESSFMPSYKNIYIYPRVKKRNDLSLRSYRTTP